MLSISKWKSYLDVFQRERGEGEARKITQTVGNGNEIKAETDNNNNFPILTNEKVAK